MRNRGIHIGVAQCWETHGTWKRWPILIDRRLLDPPESGLQVVEGRTRVGVLRGRHRQGTLVAERHLAWVGRSSAHGVMRLPPRGSITRRLPLSWGFYAARWYSLMKPPRTDRRWIRSRSARGWSGPFGAELAKVRFHTSTHPHTSLQRSPEPRAFLSSSASKLPQDTGLRSPAIDAQQIASRT